MTSRPDSPDPAADSTFTDAAAWHRLYEGTAPLVRETVSAIVDAHAGDLATRFYTSLLGDTQASRLLSHDKVATHLHGSLQRWLRELFCQPAHETPDVARLARTQHHVGEVHARLLVPIPLVSRGARILKDAISEHLRASTLARDPLSHGQQYLGGLFDLALEVMSAAYLRDAKRGVRADEAYRLFSLGQNVSTERERQRAGLTEWVQAVLLDLHVVERRTVLPRVRSSDFGMWMHHKGSAMFDGAPELPTLLAALGEIDRTWLPRLAASASGAEPGALAEAVQAFQHQVANAKFLLMALFDRVAAVDGGRDPLTQLLNRRFLPSVLSREMGLAGSGQGTFSVLLVDVDHFKAINDRHGHDGGDAVLRQIAEQLQDACRAGDYVFRYGGEEFLLVLVDAGQPVLADLAEKIRQRVAGSEFRLPSGEMLRVTISLGAAAYDGHPDPERLVKRADTALYQAKHAGRDRWVLG
ncbi:diguanylate cyclase [Achromobacter sp. GG226]|uniref:diguanylate cyclase n=1 Tax=Verticiella alkaliphila TaxID=2779529 RepID=UPI001C0D1D0D|nr:diguanylate cyclase [Verticiella sp. GG226]MBU4611852.1 diguanylate cyclase [Verticiella sp. GG226]